MINRKHASNITTTPCLSCGNKLLDWELAMSYNCRECIRDINKKKRKDEAAKQSSLDFPIKFEDL